MGQARALLLDVGVSLCHILRSDRRRVVINHLDRIVSNLGRDVTAVVLEMLGLTA